MAAVSAAGEGAASSHATAAQLWKVWKGSAPEIHVVVPRQRRRRRGFRMHVRRLEPQDVTLRFGIPVTTVARTLFDLGDELTPHQLARVINEADFRNRIDPEAVRELLRRHPGHGTLGAAWALYLGGSAGTKSEGEDSYLAAVRRYGADEPCVNHEWPTADGLIEVDFAWPDKLLMVEVDGSSHRRAMTRQRDREKQATLEAAGWTVLRCRYHEIDRHARATAARLAM